MKVDARRYKNVGHRSFGYKGHAAGFFVKTDNSKSYSTAEEAARAADDILRKKVLSGDVFNSVPHRKMNFPRHGTAERQYTPRGELMTESGDDISSGASESETEPPPPKKLKLDVCTGMTTGQCTSVTKVCAPSCKSVLKSTCESKLIFDLILYFFTGC